MKEDKSEHLYIVWVAIGLVIGLIWLVRPLVIQEKAYRKIKGEITSSRLISSDYIIILNTSDIIFRASRSQSDVLQEKAVVGKEAVIWYHINLPSRGNPFTRHHIRKMVIDNEVVVPYYRGIGVAIFFISVLLAFLIACVVYIVKKVRGKE